MIPTIDGCRSGSVQTGLLRAGRRLNEESQRLVEADNLLIAPQDTISKAILHS